MLSVNFLLGTIQAKVPTTTAAILEMGGASLQVMRYMGDIWGYMGDMRYISSVALSSASPLCDGVTDAT